MRQIKFRGKRVDNGEWVYGDLIQCEKTNSTYIAFYYKDSLGVVDKYSYEVIPETVGQYTGLTDKNGKEIYEGDVIKPYMPYLKNRKLIVNYDRGSFCIYHEDNGDLEYQEDLFNACLFIQNRDSIEIVGTIFDKDNVLKED